MAAKHKDRIKGGKADKSQPYDFDPKELAMGIEVEAEHTGDPQTAMEIAMDHLKEFPDYYTRLKKMEREAEAAKSKNEDKIPLAKQKKIRQFLLRRPVKDDERFHAFAQKIGVEPDDAEPVAYGLAYKLGKGKKAKKESIMDISSSLNWLAQLREAIEEGAAEVAVRRVQHVVSGGDPNADLPHAPKHDVKRDLRKTKIIARHRDAEGIAQRAKEKLKAMTPKKESVLDIMRARYHAFIEGATPPPIPKKFKGSIKPTGGTSGYLPGTSPTSEKPARGYAKMARLGTGTRKAAGTQPPLPSGPPPKKPKAKPPSETDKALDIMRQHVAMSAAEKARKKAEAWEYSLSSIIVECRALMEISGPEHMHQQYLQMKDKHLRNAADTARAISSKVTPPERQASLRKLHRKQVGWAKEMHQKAAEHAKKHGLSAGQG